MSDPALLARLSEAIQAQHEATMRLQELASELIDHCSRMRSFTDRLDAVRQEILPQEQPMNLPRVLQGGPVVRER